MWLLLYEEECISSKWLLYWTSLEPCHPSWSTHLYEFWIMKNVYLKRSFKLYLSPPPPSGKWTTAHNGHIVHVNFCIIHVSCDITRLLWNHEPSRKPSSLGTFQNNLPWCIFVKCYQVFTFTLWKLKTIESTIKKLGKLKGMRWIPPPRVYP